MLKAAIGHNMTHIREAEQRSHSSPWLLGTQKGRFCCFYSTTWGATEAFHLILGRSANAVSNMQCQTVQVPKDLSWSITWEITQESRELTTGKVKTEDRHNKLLLKFKELLKSYYYKLLPDVSMILPMLVSISFWDHLGRISPSILQVREHLSQAVCSRSGISHGIKIKLTNWEFCKTVKLDLFLTVVLGLFPSHLIMYNSWISSCSTVFLLLL